MNMYKTYFKYYAPFISKGIIISTVLSKKLLANSRVIYNIDMLLKKYNTSGHIYVNDLGLFRFEQETLSTISVYDVDNDLHLSRKQFKMLCNTTRSII